MLVTSGLLLALLRLLCLLRHARSHPLVFSGALTGPGRPRPDVCLVFDGAWIAPGNRAGVAWVFRDMVTLSAIGGGAQACILGSALQAEVKACELGLRAAHRRGFSSLLVYTDSAILVRLLQHRIPCPISVSWSFSEVWNLLDSLSSFAVHKVPRSLVEDAHILAGQARRRHLISLSF